MQSLRQELAGAPVRIVGHDHMSVMRKNRIHRRGHRRHAARKQQAIFSAFEGREFLLRDALGRITIASILFALDAVLKVVVQFLGIRKGVCSRLNDRCGERIAELRPGLTAMHG